MMVNNPERYGRTRPLGRSCLARVRAFPARAVRSGPSRYPRASRADSETPASLIRQQTIPSPARSEPSAETDHVHPAATEREAPGNRCFYASGYGV